MRFVVWIVLGSVLAVCACVQSTPAEEAIADVPITAERQAVFMGEDFDPCSLRTPKETWAYWDATLSTEDRQTFAATKFEDLIMFHHGWGAGIRNGMCLWRGGPLSEWFHEHGIDHPDNMSALLIEMYWAHLAGCAPDASAFTTEKQDPKQLHCPDEVDLRRMTAFGELPPGSREATE